MRKTIFSIFIMVLAASCAKTEMPAPEDSKVTKDTFIATFQQPEESATTKVRLDNNMHLWWDSYGGDAISLFTGEVHSKYVATHLSSTGGDANYAIFTKEEGFDQQLGYTLDKNYAVIPYDKENSVDANGTLSIVFDGSYKLAAVTKNADDKMLYFKALGGYLRVPIYGSGRIDKVTLRGNNGEVIRGKATVKLAYSKDPELVMDSQGENETHLRGLSGEELNHGKQSVAVFVLPPITFSKGFTVEVTDVAGNVHTYTTDKERTIVRNVYNTMDSIEVHGSMYGPLDVETAQSQLDQAYDNLGRANLYWTDKPIDFGFLNNLICNDTEGPDFLFADSPYNWYGQTCQYDRSMNYYIIYDRFRVPWDAVKNVTEIIAGLVDDVTPEAKFVVGQAQALRAYAYMTLAQNFSFGPVKSPDALCVPILDETIQEPYLVASATTKEVYDFLLNDLKKAYDNLDGFSRNSTAQIDINVVNALLARACLAMEKWEDAYNYASRVVQAFTPASIQDVSVPSFMDISEKNWVWGYDRKEELYAMATPSSWIRSFSGAGYTTLAGMYAFINNLLYVQIPETDVRKGWWLDDNLESPLLDAVTWDANFWAGPSCPLFSRTNVKFGSNPVGTRVNTEDMPLVRVEEMILVMAECRARMGDDNMAASILTSFVSQYRDPSYNVNGGGRSILDEIWFQRRVELWGEGFARPDMIRFGKPLVRMHDDNVDNVPSSFRFNLEAFDQRMILPILPTILSNYPNITSPYEYESAELPATGSGAGLLDGVTD